MKIVNLLSGHTPTQLTVTQLCSFYVMPGFGTKSRCWLEITEHAFPMQVIRETFIHRMKTTLLIENVHILHRYVHTHIYTHTHTLLQRHTHTLFCMHMHTYTHTHTLAHTDTHRCTDSHMHIHRQTQLCNVRASCFPQTPSNITTPFTQLYLKIPFHFQAWQWVMLHRLHVYICAQCLLCFFNRRWRTSLSS